MPYIIPWFLLGFGFGKCCDKRRNRCCNRHNDERRDERFRR